MKSEDRPARHADAVVRHHAEHQRTRRQTRPIDDHAFAGVTQALEQIEKRADLTAGAGENANLGSRREYGEGAQDEGESNGSGESCPHGRTFLRWYDRSSAR